MRNAFEFILTDGAIPVLRRNAVRAFRLAFLQRDVVDGFPATWWQVATFGALTVLIPLLYDFATIGIAGRLDWEAVPLAIAHIPVILLAVIVTAQVLGSADQTLSLLQTFLTVAMVIDLIVYLTYFVAVRLYPQPWPYQINVAYNVLPAIWLALACARAAVGPLSGLIGKRTVGYAVCIILLALPLTRMYRERSLWQPAKNELDSSQRVLAEDALYGQPEILERELNAVKAGRRGVVDVYFIGIGGYANQDVFMKEVDAVSRLFRERFGSEGKSIRLVNNSKSLGDVPLASVTGLRKSLRRIANVMNNEEDVVFLFLTSHGSPTHRFALDFSPLQFHELTPQRLRGLLDESGIKNRVVVVSACYSGGFIEPLKTGSSLIIAASAADKNSFGCTNEAEWTYFGKAFFDEALRETHSFVEAFEAAKPVIAAREKEQGFTPSEPQMALGDDIKPTLLRLQQQFAVP
ncbi:MAG: C13 family peptidase [Candidatus Binatia bacterium]